MLDNVVCLGHNSIKFLKNNKVIYVDPYKINTNYNDADIIFITHNHYDHFSKEDILKVKKDSTKIVITEDLYNECLSLFIDDNILKVLPGNNYFIDGIEFLTVYSYNVNKSFHPKESNWVGYILNLDNYSYYIVGDSDITEESKMVRCDVLFVPIGGTYTMNVEEAYLLTDVIKPKVVVPVHYGVIVGEKEDAIRFKELVSDKYSCDILF